jgi:thermolabile hemolysin
VLRTATVLLLVSCATGCATLFHKPRPDLDLPVAERPWRAHCGWLLPPSSEPGAPPGVRESGWTWAADDGARRLILDGRLEDGFLVVEGVRAASDKDDRDVVPLAATAGAVADGCAGTLARAEPAARQLYAVRGARDGEGVDVPLVFPGDPAAPRPVSRLVVFGDSLSDTGNLKQRLLVFPASPYWLGRFSNGPNWTDDLAHRLGLAVQNHAFGGAAAIKHDDVPADDVIAAIEQGAQFFLTGSVDRQVGDYLERDLVGGAVQNPGETVYVLWGGANDYISKEPFTGDIRTLLDTPEGDAGYRRVVDEAVAALANQVRQIHAAGGRQFVVVNLPSLGRTPIPLHNTSYAPEGPPLGEEARRMRLANKLNELTAFHNRQLARALQQLARELPDATVVPVDAAKAIDLLLQSRAPDGSGRAFDYGFDLRGRAGELRDAERRRYRIQDRCYEGSYLGTDDPTKVCPEERNVMFWDAVHPTAFTHCWIAFFIQQELARKGLAAQPSAAEQRTYCAGRAEPGA